MRWKPTKLTRCFDKISKLLALSEARGATEAEANVANAHVQRLLQEHNLTLSQVEARSGKSGDDGRRTKNAINVVTWAIMRWQEHLLSGIAESNFCLARVQSYVDEKERRRKRVVFVGREVNVNTSRMMYEYLLEACYREMVDHGYQKRGQDGHYDKDGMYFFARAWPSAWSSGWQSADASARRESSAAAVRTATSGNGTHRELVLSDVYGSETDLNNDFLNGFPRGTTATKRREQAEREARQEAEHARLVAEGVDDTVAWYRAYGYSEERAVAAATSWQRQTSRRRGSGHRHSAHNWSRGDRAEYRRVNSAAYRTGREAGASVGLDEQVGGSRRRQIAKK